MSLDFQWSPEKWIRDLAADVRVGPYAVLLETLVEEFEAAAKYPNISARDRLYRVMEAVHEIYEGSAGAWPRPGRTK